MPIKAALAAAPVLVPEPPVEVPVRVRDAPRATWIAPDGREFELTRPELGWKLLRGVTGLGAMPVTLVTDKLARGGVRVRSVRREAREIDLPVRIWGRDHTQFLDRKHRLIDGFTQTDELGPGTLVVQRPDGSKRQIRAYYLEGLDDTEDGWIAENAVVTLLAEQPWWLGTDEVADEVIQRDAGGSYLDGYPNVSSSRSTLGGIEIHNPGELTSYPTWTFTGPASLITVTHEGTGQSFTLDPDFDGGGDLLAGQTIIVQTDPAAIYGPAGQAYTGALDWPGASLFGLLRGVNRVSVTFSGAANGSGVAWRFQPRYRSA